MRAFPFRGTIVPPWKSRSNWGAMPNIKLVTGYWLLVIGYLQCCYSIAAARLYCIFIASVWYLVSFFSVSGEFRGGWVVRDVFFGSSPSFFGISSLSIRRSCPSSGYLVATKSTHEVRNCIRFRYLSITHTHKQRRVCVARGGRGGVAFFWDLNASPWTSVRVRVVVHRNSIKATTKLW